MSLKKILLMIIFSKCQKSKPFLQAVTKSERIRFRRIGGFGRTLLSNDEQLLNSDVNDTTLIFSNYNQLICSIWT